VVRAQEVAGGRIDVERQHHVEPALHVGVEKAARIGDEGTLKARRAVELCRISIEGIEVDHAGERRAGVVEYAEHIVRAFEHESISGAQSLVGRLDAELVAAVGDALVAHVEAVEGPDERRVGAEDR
jgi:hypothetical protein